MSVAVSIRQGCFLRCLYVVVIMGTKISLNDEKAPSNAVTPSDQR